MFSVTLRVVQCASKSIRPFIQSRNLLSQAYASNEIWSRRLENPAFATSNASDLGLQISDKLNKGEAISPIDIDVYANLLHQLDVTSLWFSEDVLKKFRLTQQSLKTLGSTSHAVVRSFLEFQEYDRLINIIKDKSQYGVFLDDVSAIIFLNRCFETNNVALAAQVAFEVMLQEEELEKFPLLAALCLHACQLHWKSVQESGGWPPVERNEEEIDEDDIEYVVVKYVRNDNYDDHFDIAEDRLLLGKSLSSLHSVLSHQPVIANSALLLGLTMYEKFDELSQEVERMITEKSSVSKNTIDDILFLLDSTPTLSEGEENGPRKRNFITESEKSGIIEKFQEALPKLTTSPKNFHDLCSEFVQAVIQETEENEINRVQKLYQEFEDERNQMINHEMAESQRKTVKEAAKRKLRELLDQEELLLSFENRADIDYAAWLAPRSRAESRRTRREEWQVDIDNVPKTKSRSFLDFE